MTPEQIRRWERAEHNGTVAYRIRLDGETVAGIFYDLATRQSQFAIKGGIVCTTGPCDLEKIVDDAEASLVDSGYRLTADGVERDRV